MALLSVKDEEKSTDDIEHHRIELCEDKNDELRTEEVIGYVEEITDYSFPETLLD